MSVIDELVENLVKDDSDVFRKVGDGVSVRSLFGTEDLRLVRRAFIGYIRSGLAGSDGVECRNLFRRMLRRVK
jgi:hypothetical protein